MERFDDIVIINFILSPKISYLYLIFVKFVVCVCCVCFFFRRLFWKHFISHNHNKAGSYPKLGFHCSFLARVFHSQMRRKWLIQLISLEKISATRFGKGIFAVWSQYYGCRDKKKQPLTICLVISNSRAAVYNLIHFGTRRPLNDFTHIQQPYRWSNETLYLCYLHFIKQVQNKNNRFKWLKQSFSIILIAVIVRPN